MKNIYAIVVGTMLLSVASDMVALTYVYIDNKTKSTITAYEGKNVISIPAGKTVKVGSIERIPYLTSLKASITITANLFSFSVYTAGIRTKFMAQGVVTRGQICWQIKDNSGNVILESENMSQYPKGSSGCPRDRSTRFGGYLVRGECKGLDLLRDPDIYFTISE